MPDDPFPRERFAAMLRRMPAYLRLAWRLAKDPLLSKARRAAVVGAAGYLASPIDLVPGVVPVLGQLDDIAVAIAALRLALAGLSPDQRRAHLDAVGLSDRVLGEDLRTIGVTTAWIGRASYRATKRAAATGTQAAVAGAGVAARTTRAAVAKATPATKAVTDRAAPAARAVTDRAAPAARAVADRAAPAARAVTDRAAPAAKATGRAARAAGGKAVGAAGAAFRKVPKPGRAKDPEVLVTEVDLPLLPPPPAGSSQE